MRTRSAAVIACAVFASFAHAQTTEVTSFRSSGTVSWSAPSGSVCTVEWKSSLASTAAWQRSWNSIDGVLMAGPSTTAAVPMVYRVTCNTNPISMVTPYVSQSDMRWIRQGYSATTNAPWNFAHDGVDPQPTNDRAPFRAVCAGTIADVALRQEPDQGEGRMWDVQVVLLYDPTWSASYSFEPKTTNAADGWTQLTNIVVSLWQSVTQGQTIGYLHQADQSAHVHLSLRRNAECVCPDPFFTHAARTSIVYLLRQRFTNATGMCY